MSFRISDAFIEEQNAQHAPRLARDYGALSNQLADRGLSADAITSQVAALQVAVPSWGVGTGGTRFARFPGVGEPATIEHKLEDCATIHQLGRTSPTVSPHFPWDQPEDPHALKHYADALGLGFDAVNSNTFQDQPGQLHSYKFGSLTHADPAVREQAIAHNIECIELGKALGSKALTVWIADGSNFPGQNDFAQSFERYIESVRAIYEAMPDDWTLFIEHKFFEPAFYSTVIADWGSSYLAATSVGERAKCLVDLGHHAPNTNIEMIVSRLAQFGRLGGFHFNDSKYGDDDLDTGSINPFQLFLVFNELIIASERDAAFSPAYMLDQSHNVTDPIESLILSGEAVARAYAQSLLVDRAALAEAQRRNDVIAARELLNEAYRTDVSPILMQARSQSGGAIDPIAVFRASNYRAHKAQERPAQTGTSSGIV